MQFTQWLHRALQQYPDRLITIDQGREHTVEQFADRVARLAAGLRANGVRPGDRVGMLSLNSDRYVEYLTAVPWLGAALNAVNIRWSLAEIGYSLRESGTRVLLVDDTFKAAAAPLRAACACLETVIYCGPGPAPQDMIGYEDLLAAHEPIDDTRTGGDSLLGVFYTGGTTGNPRASCYLIIMCWPPRWDRCPPAISSPAAAACCTRRRCSIWPTSAPYWRGTCPVPPM
ncbi:AMP-binding enzyme family protein [Mycobacteroides abscessus subsp. bolletii 1513]|uniref:AMP-binding enzyme family protein n=1 Tax=Mycobacteroides abscessus subsp. bolletii 1513 TaxID=1299321 RepID=X8DJ24_9MYCO|nr:AMP-binding enzyme family protein [Mycobacteroides abscessus subsp. bolletii 1513]